MPVDLHVHSTASDGTLSPAEVIAKACSLGLAAVAITDHDTLAGLPEAREAAQGKIHFVPGLEISTHQANKELHILAYYPDPTHDELRAVLQRLQQARLQRLRETVLRLRDLGITISHEDVAAEVGDSHSPGRPHVAAALVRLGVVQDAAEAFAHYLRRGRPAYVDRFRIAPGEAVQLIRQAGGLPVVAHPGLMHRDSLITPLVKGGLGGIEAYHVKHSAADTTRYLAYAQRQGLLVTGGSDSHGPEGPDPVPLGAVEVPEECAEALLKWRQGG